MSAQGTSHPADLAEVLAPSTRGRPRRLLLGLLGLLALGLIALAVIGGLSSSTAGVQFKTQPVTRGELRVQVTATGTLEPVNQGEVGTEVSGTIEAVLVDYNDRVRKGDVLARLDTAQLEARFRQSEAALALARARVQDAQATIIETGNKLRRTQDLIGKRLSSPEELDAASASSARAEAALAVARAQVDQAQAELDANRRVLDKAVIRSPIDGIVLKRTVEPGQTVAASLQTPVLFTLAENLAQMELHVDVDEADVGQVAEDQGAEFTVDAYPDRHFPAQIKQVRFAPKTVEGVVTYETLLSVDNAKLLLRPGMTATAEILVKQVQDALLVPNAALRFSPPKGTGRPGAGQSRSEGGGLVGMLLPRRPPSDKHGNDAAKGSKGGQRRVWVLRDDQPEAVEVHTGATDGILTQILDGPLEPGMEVLVDTLSGGR
jgi:HlyD family secretion protein